MTRIRPILIFVVVVGSFLSFASAQPQQGGNPQPQNAPPAGQQPPNGGNSHNQPQSPNGQSPQGGQSGQGQMKPDGQCKKEMEKACPGMHPGDGKFGPCVKENMDNFTPKCKRRIRHMMHNRMKGQGQGGQGTQGQNPQGNESQEGPQGQTGADDSQQ